MGRLLPYGGSLSRNHAWSADSTASQLTSNKRLMIGVVWIYDERFSGLAAGLRRGDGTTTARGVGTADRAGPRGLDRPSPGLGRRVRRAVRTAAADGSVACRAAE